MPKDQIDKIVDKLLKDHEKNLGQKYQATLQKIRGELAEMSAKYGTLTWANLQKYGRLEAFEKYVNQQLGSLSSQTTHLLNTTQRAAYQQSFYRQAYMIEKNLQVKLSYRVLNPNVIERAVTNPLNKGSLLKISSQLRGNVNQAIAQGLIRGDSYSAIASQIKDAMNISANRAYTIARTEAHRCQNAGRMDSADHAQENGVEFRKVWDSAIDGRTRDSHQNLDGEQVEYGEKFSNGLEYPGDPAGSPEEVINCRCSVRMEIKGFEPKERRVRGDGVIPYTTFNEYASERGFPI